METYVIKGNVNDITYMHELIRLRRIKFAQTTYVTYVP